MKYKPVPNKDYTHEMADRDGKEIRKALKSAKAYDWSKLEKIQAILQQNAPTNVKLCVK